jgi:hypothetical protein
MQLKSAGSLEARHAVSLSKECFMKTYLGVKAGFVK